MNYKICDIHAHVVPQIDDGANSIAMAMEMLRSAYNQGARNIVCASHSWGNLRDYAGSLETLQSQAKKENISVNLYPGCEVQCSEDTMDNIISGFNSGRIPTLNKTRFVLIEFDPQVCAHEVENCVKFILTHGYKPVISHVERYHKLFENDSYIQRLYKLGCLFQINAYSIEDTDDLNHKKAARKLLDDKYVSFIGSDAHRTTHRPYKIEHGIEYIQKHCSPKYAKAICFENAERLLGIMKNVNYRGIFNDFIIVDSFDYWSKFHDVMWELGFEMDMYKSFKAVYSVPAEIKEDELNDWTLSKLKEAPIHITGNFVFSHFRHLTHWSDCGFGGLSGDYLFINSLPILERKLVEYGIERIPSISFFGD